MTGFPHPSDLGNFNSPRIKLEGVERTCAVAEVLPNKQNNNPMIQVL